ncbi:hypothetical protein Csa_000786 [Cucumis sativus]|nr:hypothetical protein Csa_000786 [Cucumis sativus]
MDNVMSDKGSMVSGQQGVAADSLYKEGAQLSFLLPTQLEWRRVGQHGRAEKRRLTQTS